MSDQLASSMANATSKPQGYRDLLVRQKGIALAKMIYQITETFPAAEKFGLISQMRRAAVSIPSNLAEGQARHTTGEFVLCLSHAEGSLAELETQLILAVELRDCFKIQSGPAARDFGADQGGAVRASPQRADCLRAAHVDSGQLTGRGLISQWTEPTPVRGKRPDGGSVGILKQSHIQANLAKK